MSVSPRELELVCRPIGVVHSPFRERREAPRQPAASAETRGSIELFPHSGFEHALADVEAWSYLWVVFWFHLNAGFRPKVLPPRSARRRGVFSTRSPHRPNPIGLSAVKLERVNGLVLEVSGLDMLDGTPVLDLKPYVAYTDAVSEAGTGWLSGALDPAPVFSVTFTDDAAAQLAYLKDAWGAELEASIREVLALGPQAHPYRRIRRERTHGARRRRTTSAGGTEHPLGEAEGAQGNGAHLASGSETFVLAVKDWRARFVVERTRITVLALRTGYRPRELVENTSRELDAHRDFVARFGT